MRIYPAIDLRGGQCVRLQQGDYARETVFSAEPAAMARRFAHEGAEFLHLVDLDGAKAGQPRNLPAVTAIMEATGLPCQLGGGIRDDETITRLLHEVHLARVIVGTRALRDPDWFRATVEQYPGRVVLGLDARDSRVAAFGWTEVSNVSIMELADTYRGLPLAALVYTNIANDGMMQGIDAATLADLEALAQLGFPVIASGGVTSERDLENLCEIHRRTPQLEGAIIGRALYDGALTVSGAIATVARCLGH